MRNKLLLVLFTAFVATDAYPQKPRLDPTHVMGADACAECHGKEVDAWKKTTHFETFKSLEKDPKADKIATAMGVKNVAADGLCIECHFTLQKKGARTRAISGISCESCHGAAKDWIKEHNKEKVARAERKANAEAGGMLYPENLYAVASNCFDCHIVDKEALVNKGGHPAFSEDFDLAAWSQGEVRHSFMKPGNPVKESGDTNRAASPERKRMLYMVGKILALEYSFRAVSKATTAKAKPPGGGQAYGVQHALRAGGNTGFIKQLEALNKLIPTDEVAAIIEVAKGVPLSTSVEARKKALAAAGEISTLAKKFAANHDGSKFAAIDSKIPAPKGTAYTP